MLDFRAIAIDLTGDLEDMLLKVGNSIVEDQDFLDAARLAGIVPPPQELEDD